MIFLVVLLFFGAKRLPDLFRSLGKSMREFKKATSDIEDDIRTAMDEEPKTKKPATTESNSSTAATTAPKEVEADTLADELESDDIPTKNESETKDKASA